MRGRAAIADLRAHWKQYLADPDVLRIRRTLVDLRDADIQFMGGELDDLVQTLLIPVLSGRPWVTAIVVAKPVQFGVSRQCQAFAERYSSASIFHEPDLAKAWLLSSV